MPLPDSRIVLLFFEILAFKALRLIIQEMTQPWCVLASAVERERAPDALMILSSVWSNDAGNGVRST
jgi:hypothetical protein